MTLALPPRPLVISRGRRDRNEWHDLVVLARTDVDELVVKRPTTYGNPHLVTFGWMLAGQYLDA
eukprot:2791425-Heterocapsa_arctica.AAC.1